MAILGLLGVGFALGLLAPFARYAYGDTTGVLYRFDRLTGVQQYPSSSGWVTNDEISKRVEARLAPEIARFSERVAQMREAQKSGALRKIDVTGRQVSAYYTDGRKEEYYALDTADPRLDDVQRIADRLTPPASGGTAGGTGE